MTVEYFYNPFPACGKPFPDSRWLARANFNGALVLSTEKINEIYLLAIALSAEAERVAFICGVKLGVQLTMETKNAITLY